jgi:hypothetical protein
MDESNDDEPTAEDLATDALIVYCLRFPDDDDWIDTANLPELDEAERAAMEGLGPDLIKRLLAEHPAK